MISVELFRWVWILLVELIRNHPQQGLTGVASKPEVVQTFLPETEINDVLDVAGDDGDLGEGAHAEDEDGRSALLWSGVWHHSGEIFEQNLQKDFYQNPFQVVGVHFLPERLLCQYLLTAPTPTRASLGKSLLPKWPLR